MDVLTNLFQIVLHLDRYLGEVITQYGGWTYGILSAVIFMETGLVVTPFLPGDSLLFAAGAVAATGALRVSALWPLLFAAAVLGDNTNYWIGRYVGPRAFRADTRWFKREYLERAHQFYEKYGGKTVTLARFLPILRTFAPFVAGIGRMDYRHFIFFSLLGGTLWTGSFILGGYFFGNLPFVKANFTYVILAIIVISLAPTFIEVIRHRRGTPSAPTEP